MKWQKGSVLIWIILIILLSALGLFSYLFLKKKSEQKTVQPSQIAQPKEEEWSTYTNQQIGFSFEYPSDWTYEESTFPQVKWENIKVSFKPVDFVVEVNPSASLAVLTHALEGYEKVLEESVKIGGVQAKKYTWQTTAKGEELYGDKYKIVYVKFTHNSAQYTVYLKYKTVDESSQLKKFDHILGSFKFLEETSEAPEGWTKYINKEIGYTLFYPKNWVLTEKNFYSEIVQQPVKYIEIYDPAAKHYFYFGLKKSNQNFGITERTGISAGDFQQISEGVVNILGVNVIPEALIYEGAVKEFFWQQPSGTDKTCNCQFWANFNSKSGKFDSDSSDVIDIPNKILKSVKWL